MYRCWTNGNIPARDHYYEVSCEVRACTSRHAQSHPYSMAEASEVSPHHTYLYAPGDLRSEHVSVSGQSILVPFRLAHVAVRCPSVARQSLSLAIPIAQQGKDVHVYGKLCELASQKHFSDLRQPDQEWMLKQEEANKRELSRLEGELRGYKNNLIRESIRMGQEDLATHQLSTGGPAPDPSSAPLSQASAGYNAAYQAFGKMRDYCNTPTHIASMTLRMMYTNIVHAASVQSTGNNAATHFGNVLTNASRLRNVGVREEEQIKLTPIACMCIGIAHMSHGNYSDAASSFLATPFGYRDLGPVHSMDFSRLVATPNDIAIYGGLCALATRSRQELLDDVLGGNFRAFLELEPHMRKAISLYTTAKYQACLATLRHYYSDWNLDVFLGAFLPSSLEPQSHVDVLLARIREKSITAYFSAFSEVSLTSLASTFPPTSDSPEAMEREVLSLIESGALDARLDVVKSVLIAPRTEARASTHASAKTAADEVERSLLLRLHKVNVSLAGFELSRPKNWEVPVGNGGGYWGGT
nr:cop9 signalosome complex subunit 1 [Quercus suber]